MEQVGRKMKSVLELLKKRDAKRDENEVSGISGDMEYLAKLVAKYGLQAKLSDVIESEHEKEDTEDE